MLETKQPIEEVPTKSGEASFEIVFEGNVHPQDLSFSDLGSAITALGRLASGGSEDGDDQVEPAKQKMHLVGVRGGSAHYLLSTENVDRSREQLRLAGGYFDDLQIDSLNAHVLTPGSILSKLASKLKTTIVIKVPGDGPVLARIGPDLSEAIDAQFFTSPLKFAARVVRVGGASGSKCGLRVASRRKMLICVVSSPKVARQLGALLYQNVIVKGTATWIKSTMTLYGFSIVEVQPMKRTRAVEAFRLLRAAGGHYWDAIKDVEAFLNGEEELSQ
jgi:hypothetical protein